MADQDPWDALWDLVDDRLPEYDLIKLGDASDIVDAIRLAGWRPPAPLITTREQLDALGWPCVIREIPAEGEIEFYPQIWEKTFQTDGWNRAGAMWREKDCTPRLPVEVLVEPEVNRG